MVSNAAFLECPSSMAGRSVLFHVPKQEVLPHVLCAEQGSGSLVSRIRALEAMGFHVRSAGPREIPDLVHEVSFRVVVFGQTLSYAETAALAVYTRTVSPGTKLVLVTGTEPRRRMLEPVFDAIVPEAKGIAALAISVRRLLASDSG